MSSRPLLAPTPRRGTEQPPAAFSPAAALTRVGQLGLVCAGLGGIYLATGAGIQCGLARLGVLCPFCGGTRMVASMLRGDLAAALHWNPMLFFGGILLALVCLAWVVEWAGGPALRWPARWGRLTEKRLYVVAAVVAGVFMVVRNVA